MKQLLIPLLPQGWKAFNEHNGFTSAQGTLNIIESLMYGYYLYILYTYGKQSKAQGRGAPKASAVGFLGQQRFVDGKMGALAVLVAYSAALMTVSKTVLYCKLSVVDCGATWRLLIFSRAQRIPLWV